MSSNPIALTIANCRLISPPDAEFEIITSREPAVSWTALLLRTVDGCRDLFLSADGPVPMAALYALHEKSGDAVRAHIRLNGYGIGSKNGLSKTRNASNPSLSDSTLTVDVLDNDLSMSSGCESLSDDEIVSVTSGAGGKKKKHKSRKEHKLKEEGKDSDVRPSRSRSRSRSSSHSTVRSRSSSSSGVSESEFEAPRVAWVPPVPQFPMRPAGAGNPPPPPPGYTSGYTSWPPHMAGMTRMVNGTGQPTSAPSPPTQPKMVYNYHDVLIRVHWVGRGYAQVMKRLVVNRSALQSAALSYVRGNPGAFSGAQPSDQQAMKMPMGSPGSMSLFVSLRSVSIAGEQIDLRNYRGEKLSTLLQEDQDSRGRLPKFEIDVSSTPPRPYSTMAAMGAARPTSTGPVASDC